MEKKNTGLVILVIILSLLVVGLGGFIVYDKVLSDDRIEDNKINNENKGWLFSYLRKIDPFVFEELILHTFKMKGFKIKRNKKYTGDGGIDGKVVINNQLYLIQAKRYSNFINPRHIENFASLCKSYNTKGFFIHTGKTGPESKNITKQFKNIEIISGSKLFDFFIENKEVTNDKL